MVFDYLRQMTNHMNQEDKELLQDTFNDDLNEAVRWLFERRRMEGLFPVYFILYSYRHSLTPLFDEETGDFIYAPGADSLQDRLYEAAKAFFGGDGSQFDFLGDIAELVESLPKSLFREMYPRLLDRALAWTDLVAGTQMQPNARIAETAAAILREHGCESVITAYSGIGVFALACEGMKYTGIEPCAQANLIAEVLCDGFGVRRTEFIFSDPLSEWTRRKADGLIGNLPVDAEFFNEYQADHLMTNFNSMQDRFIRKLIERGTARRTAVVLVHFEFANKADYDSTRRLICEKGMLETVIALPEDIFRDARVPTYMLVLDMEGGRREAEFIDATQSLIRQGAVYHTIRANRFDMRKCAGESERVTVDYDTVARCSWAFNPAVYIQDAVCREGQESVRLGDLVTVSPGHLTEGERYVDYKFLSQEFGRVAAGLTPGAPVASQVQLVRGPSVMVALNAAPRRHSVDLLCGICREYGTYGVTYFLPVLQPLQDRILPDYLALALMEDPSFARYLRNIQQYYTDDVRSSHLLERRIPVLTDLAAQKKAVMDALGRADMSAVTYNVIVAGAGRLLGRYRSALAHHGCTVLASAEAVEGPEGLEGLLEKLTADAAPVSRRADAVIVLSDIPLGGRADADPFEGLDAALDLSLLYGRKGLPFFVSSSCTMEEIAASGFISPRRLRPLGEGRFFRTGGDGAPAPALAASVRETLDRQMSAEARIRSRHAAALEAADWLDGAYPDREIHASEILSEFLLAAEEGVDTSRKLSDLRNVAHRIIEILKDCRVVPRLDNGAVPRLLHDGKFEDTKKNRDGKTYFQDIDIMSPALSASLVALIDIGNEGTHSFRSSANLGSSMLQTLLELVTWFHSRRDEFSVQRTGYWHVESKYESTWDETTGPAVYQVPEGAKPFWSCGDIALYVGNGSDLEADDIVTVRKRVPNDDKERYPGMKFFAFPMSEKHRDGYTFEKASDRQDG